MEHHACLAASLHTHNSSTAAQQHNFLMPCLSVLQVFSYFRDKPVCPVGKDPDQYLYEGALSTVVALLAKPGQVSSLH